MKVSDSSGKVFDYNAINDINNAGWGVLSYDGTNMAEVMDTTGKRGTINISQFLSAKGYKPVDTSVLNTPETAIEASPLESWQRIAIGFGTKSGNLDFLNNFYEKATILQNGKYAVSHNGMWYKVDEKGFTLGDIEESLGKIGVVIGSSLGAAGGTFVGGPAGSYAGASGGAIASEYFRQQIGKKMGTVQNTDAVEIVIEGASALAGMALSNAASKFAGKGLRTASQMLKKIDVDSQGGGLLSKVDDFMGISKGSTSTLVNFTDDVTNFKKWKGLKPVGDMSDDINKWQGNLLKGLSQEKERIRVEARSLGKYITPNQVYSQVVDEANGKTLGKYLVEKHINGTADDTLRITSPMLKKFDTMMKTGSVTFDDTSALIEQIDDVMRSAYEGGFNRETLAQSSLGKIRFALGKARDAEFNTGKAFDAMESLLKLTKDAKGKPIFGNSQKTMAVLRELDNPNNELLRNQLMVLASQDEDFAKILLKREIWKASNHFSRLVGSGSHLTKTNVGGSGGGLLSRPGLIGMAAAVGWGHGGLPGLVIGGGLASTVMSPRTVALAVQSTNLLKQLGISAANQATPRLARQELRELGGLQPGG